MLPIYLDYNATTPVDARVLERMLPYFSTHFGNASSKGHAYGWHADEAVTEAREALAALLGADPEGVVFTGGATEALNTAIKGVALAYTRKGLHLVTVATEHKAVLASCRALERDGFSVTVVPVDAAGRVSLEALDAAITEETSLVAVMTANNETGVCHPIPAISEIVHAKGALLLTDATQALGKVPVSVEGVDLLACSGHKVYGPKGVGALYIRPGHPRIRVLPLIDGGSQESKRRAGTLNVPGIVGLGAAAAVAQADLAADAARLETLRNRLEADITEALPQVRINGVTTNRLPQTSSLTFPGLPANTLTTRLRGLAASAGSACASGSGAPSHVLTAMGLSAADARSTLRFSLGRPTTEAEVEATIAQVVEAVTPLYEAVPV